MYIYSVRQEYVKMDIWFASVVGSIAGSYARDPRPLPQDDEVLNHMSDARRKVENDKVRWTFSIS